jgi:hypothetical protein
MTVARALPPDVSFTSVVSRMVMERHASTLAPIS